MSNLASLPLKKEISNEIKEELLIASHIRANGEFWHKNVLDSIEENLSQIDFPCVFGKNASQKKLIHYIFVESLDEIGISALAKGLDRYVEISTAWDGKLATAYPLVVAFSLQLARNKSLEEYHEFGWKVLQKLHEIDSKPWPMQVSEDPNSETWSMCFGGMPLFCNMSHPAHINRRSRNLGEHFIFIINPRERFDAVAGDTPSGRKMRLHIRERVHKYDGIKPAPQLGWYGSGGLEWWQYELLEKNTERSDKCPFTFKKAL